MVEKSVESMVGLTLEESGGAIVVQSISASGAAAGSQVFQALNSNP